MGDVGTWERKCGKDGGKLTHNLCTVTPLESLQPELGNKRHSRGQHNAFSHHVHGEVEFIGTKFYSF